MKILKAIAIALIIVMLFSLVGCMGIINYPKLRNRVKENKWYRVETDAMKDSEGGEYHALFRKGSENKVMIYFAGGGEVSTKKRLATIRTTPNWYSPTRLQMLL